MPPSNDLFIHDDTLTFEMVDRDGAIAEAAEELAGHSRADFLRRAGLAAGGALLASGVAGGLAGRAAAATPRPTAASDVAILKYALTLEYLEAAFYKEAVDAGRLHGDVRAFARKVARDEATHVAALRKALGSQAQASPRFDFQGTTRSRAKFLKTSYDLENTGVAAYLGQAPNIKDPSILLTAASIVTVEARHSGAVGELLGRNISPAGAFDGGKTMEQVLAIVNKTKFIRSA
jgi:rubrerythrin